MTSRALAFGTAGRHAIKAFAAIELGKRFGKTGLSRRCRLGLTRFRLALPPTQTMVTIGKTRGPKEDQKVRIRKLLRWALQTVQYSFHRDLRKQ